MINEAISITYSVISYIYNNMGQYYIAYNRVFIAVVLYASHV